MSVSPCMYFVSYPACTSSIAWVGDLCLSTFGSSIVDIVYILCQKSSSLVDLFVSLRFLLLVSDGSIVLEYRRV